MTQANFKYTFPIAKAEQRADGYYIVGFASGPEVDTEGERMAPEAIERFAAQINDGSVDRLTYRDAHQPDGVLRDLGEITKAWVTEHFHLGVEVKLDESNPASMYLYRQIKDKGKQYGMSVAGHVVDYAMEFAAEVGKSVLTYKNVVLDEISNTTRPAWYPSFGTVLAKSIKDASSDDATGETAVKVGPNGELLDENVEDATKSEADESAEDTTEKAADEVADSTDETVEKADESTDDDAETTEKSDADDAEVEKAGRKLSGATATKLLGLFSEMQATLTDLGVLATGDGAEETTSEKSASAAEEDTTEKTDGADSTEPVITKSDLDALAAALAKANERIAELEARPATVVPGVITDATKKATEEELAEVLAKASPSDKLRLAFAAHTGGK